MSLGLSELNRKIKTKSDVAAKRAVGLFAAFDPNSFQELTRDTAIYLSVMFNTVQFDFPDTVSNVKTDRVADPAQK